jgi:translation initiation factor IF-2
VVKKVRVYELARELHLSSDALVSMLKDMAITVKSHMSTLDEATMARIRETLSRQREEVKRDAERKQKVQAEIARKQEEPKAGADALKKKDRKRRRNRKRRTVDQAAVERNVRETLATMSTAKRKIRRRRDEREESEAATEAVQVTEFITLGELANLFGLDPSELIRHCLTLGILANINKRLDRDAIELLAAEFNVAVEFDAEFGADIMEEIHEEESTSELVHRPPVVTVMGHVDHGKTSLLDSIRKSHVVAGEAGGITQHIGAYEVTVPKGRIVFLDTPGHEAFTAMRARGAEITDIVILVVAANDSVMPQTVEAINHARAAGVPIVVAVNKTDLPDANPQRVRQDLTHHGIVPEEWGGADVFVDISAKTGKNVDALLDMVLLVAEMKELTASPDRLCRAVVLEAHIDRGRGVVATVLVEDGTLRVGDAFICGDQGGKVRALHDDRGTRIPEAGPAKPVEVQGWSGMPQAGDTFQVLKDDQTVREIMLKRQQISREQRVRRQSVVNLANLHQQIAKGEMQDLNVIVKADAQGSVEVLCDAFEKLSIAEVRVRVLHRGVGTINESDVLLAAASRALIFGFHTKKEPRATAAAEREKVEVRVYDVIYEAVNDLKLAMEGLLKPEEIEHIRGVAEVRQLFSIPKAGVIAGSFIASGTASTSCRARVIRAGQVVYTGRIASLRRFKDEVKEVEAGLECGIGLEGFDKLQAGDVIQFIETEQILRKIS